MDMKKLEEGSPKDAMRMGLLRATSMSEAQNLCQYLLGKSSMTHMQNSLSILVLINYLSEASYVELA